MYTILLYKIKYKIKYKTIYISQLSATRSQSTGDVATTCPLSMRVTVMGYGISKSRRRSELRRGLPKSLRDVMLEQKR